MIKWPVRSWEKAPLRCKIFGHVAVGYAGGMPYLTARSGVVDGIKRHHIKLDAKCDICGTTHQIAYIHQATVDKVRN